MTDRPPSDAMDSSATRSRRDPSLDDGLQRDVYCVAGLPIDAIDMAGAVDKVRRAAHTRTRCIIATPNLNFLMSAQTDPEFRASVLRSDLCLADGMPLIWVARLLALPIPERVAGSELFDRLLAHEGRPVTVYFFGGPPGAAAAACSKLQRSGGGLLCVGYEEVPFAPVEALSSDDMIERINQSGAEFVIVSLGARKGQAWIERNRDRICAPVICHLGAVVNFAAGTVSRAPRSMQALGLEWLWRIKEEPALWRRYAKDGLAFVALLRKHVLPHAWRLRFRSSERTKPPTLRVDSQGERTRLVLSGTWTRSDLAPLRTALIAAAQAGAKVQVSLDDVEGGDSAFVALLMLATGSRQLSVSVTSTSDGANRVLQDWRAEFLLGTAAA
ncbi:MAG: WecB/TagA/CpsF family glycosyltransferase [Caldimonas sp.]